MESRYAPKRFFANEWEENIEDLNTFFNQMSRDEKTKLFKDQNFKKFICDNISKPQIGSFLCYLQYDETLDFVDNEFVKLIKTKNKRDFDYLYSYINKNALEEILLTDIGYDLINFESISGVLSGKWDIKLKVRILSYSLSKNINEQVLSNIVKSMYYQAYDRSEDYDYSINYKEIYMFSAFFKEEDVKQKFFQSIELLKALAPENRSELYENCRFQDFTKRDKENLIELLCCGYETKLPNEILFNDEFLDLVAKIENQDEYRFAKLLIKEQSESAYNKLENKKNKHVKEFKNQILTTSYDKICESYVCLEEMVKSIFYKHFKSTLRDACIKASVIKDAMNSFPEYESKFTQEGKLLIDKLIHLAKSQEDIGLIRKKMYSNDKFVEFNKENYFILQDIIELLKNVEDMSEPFEKAISKARICFTQDMNKNLYQFQEQNLKDNLDGVKIYDVTKNKKFHLLVHRTSVYSDEKLFKFPEVEEGKYLNTSMSIINNNHLNTYGSDILEERDVVFGYSNVDVSEVVHALPTDSFTNLRNDRKNSSTNKKWRMVESNSAPTYICLSDFMANMSSENINEIKLHMKPNVEDKYGRTFVKPDYIVCFDEVRDIDKTIAKKHNLPIVFINRKEVKKFPEGEYYKPIMYKSNASLSGAFEYDNQYLLQ